MTGLRRREALLLPLALAFRPDGARAASGTSAVFSFETAVPKGVSFMRSGPALSWQGNGLRRHDEDEPRFVAGAGGARGLLIEGSLDRMVPELGRWGGQTGAVEGPAGGGSAVAAGRPEAGSSPLPLPRARLDQVITASVFVRDLSQATPQAPNAGSWTIALRSPYLNEVSATTAVVGAGWTRLSVTRPSYLSEEALLDFHPAWPGTEATAAPDRVALWGAQAEPGARASSPLPAGARSRAEDIVQVSGALFERPEGCVRFDLPEGATRGGALLDGEDGFSLVLNGSGRLVARVGALTVEGFGDATGHTVVELSWSVRGIGVGSGLGSVKDKAFVSGAGASPRAGSLVRLLARQDGSAPANTVLARLVIADRAAIDRPVQGPTLAPSGYAVSFADEFDDPDTLRINEDGRWERGGPFWRSRHRWSRFDVINKEKQIYMDRGFAGTGDTPLGVDPFSIQNGVLTITAQAAAPATRSAIKDYAYTSGMISSATSHSQTYGYFEARCRVPPGRGCWPAFWLLPLAETWPPEIDILEGSGARRFSFSTGSIGTDSPFGQLWTDDRGDMTDFHTYALEWTTKELVLFVDGVELRRGRNFVDQPMFVVANLAMGSHEPRWIPDPDDSTPLPARFEIDHIRCWSRR